MTDRVTSNDAAMRTIVVDMSSEAIAQRIRDASELNELGLSLAKAKPCKSPYGNSQEDEPAKQDN